jgi:ribosomal protein S18 acetylase RimI-like enzyme
MTGEGFTVRPAVPTDARALGRLGGALVRFHHAIDPSRFLVAPDLDRGYGRWLGRELAAPEAVVLVAAAPEGELLGYVYGRVEARDWMRLLDAHADLHDILVADGARGRGVGRALLAAFVAAVRARGTPRVVLQTAFANERAQAVFREAGFRPTMIEMTLDLPDPAGD